MHRRLILLCAAALLAQPALAQTPADSTRPNTVRTLRAARATGSIDIDGRLDEAAWATAETANSFTQSYPKAGAAPTERTEARVLYSDDAIYVAMRMFDSRPDSIAAQLARRDASGIYSDWVHVSIDSYHDRRTGFRFSLNPRGVQKDVFHSNDTGEDLDWDAVWQSAARVDSLGWTAEFRIPLSQIRFSGSEPAGGRVWGLQLQRDIARRDERDSWSPWTRTDAGFVSRFGDVTGLTGIRPVRRMELLPYVSNRLTREPGDTENPFYSSNDVGLSAGADFKLGITSGLTLTGTVNPDFGQVEVDPAVVNLSAFETFFPEKRPFFIEGSDVFRFGQVGTFNNYGFQEYFYSRRIGRTPQRQLSGSEIRFSDVPSQSTILGAGKVSGKVGPWTLGIMDAVTATEKARFVTEDGDRQTATVEPLTNYFVSRVRREMHGGNTVIGGMATATHRDMSDAAFDPLVRSRAFFGGLDGEHSWANRLWKVSGYVAATSVAGSREVITAAQRSSARYYDRPDADYLSLDPTRTSLTGHIAEAAIQRSGNWDLSLDVKEMSPGFEVNDLGFQGRTDYRSFTTFLGRRVNEAKGIFRDHSYFGYTFHAWNFGGDVILNGGALGANGTFKNFWSAGGNLGYRPWTSDDRLTRGGPLSRNPGRREISGWVETDARKRVSFGANTGYVRRDAGGSSRWAGLSMSYRPSSAIRLRLSPNIENEFGTAQYVRTVDDALATETFGRRYVFADLDQTTVSMETRLDWTFTSRLSLQLFAQPFVAVGDYSGFKELERPGSYDFGVYGRDGGTISRGASCSNPSGAGTSYLVDPDGAGAASCFSFGERDFNSRSLRGNAVLRWEYRPGSALFFVWQQQRDGFDAVGDLDFGRDAGEVFRAPASNVFVVKATYWLGR
ncbi:MAG TPA: DUF5916 domain-containing protein [Longimicrobium sp.]|jgi:hypothetical protein